MSFVYQVSVAGDGRHANTKWPIRPRRPTTSAACMHVALVARQVVRAHRLIFFLLSDRPESAVAWLLATQCHKLLLTSAQAWQVNQFSEAIWLVQLHGYAMPGKHDQPREIRPTSMPVGMRKDRALEV